MHVNDKFIVGFAVVYWSFINLVGVGHLQPQQQLVKEHDQRHVAECVQEESQFPSIFRDWREKSKHEADL